MKINNNDRSTIHDLFILFILLVTVVVVVVGVVGVAAGDAVAMVVATMADRAAGELCLVVRCGCFCCRRRRRRQRGFEPWLWSFLWLSGHTKT